MSVFHHNYTCTELCQRLNRCMPLISLIIVTFEYFRFLGFISWWLYASLCCVLQVYMLSWIERQAAATLFATPPSATIDQALDHFLKVNCFYLRLSIW